jgi:hypothetical protein
MFVNYFHWQCKAFRLAVSIKQVLLTLWLSKFKFCMIQDARSNGVRVGLIDPTVPILGLPPIPYFFGLIFRH